MALITYEELKKIAELAKLSLESEDMEALAADMSDIMKIANSIDEADLTSLNCTGESETARLRDDIAKPSFEVEKILQNAAESRDGFFAGPETGGGVHV